MNEPRYASSARVKEVNGRRCWFAICDICGRETPSFKGFDLHYDFIDSGGGYRMGLCKKCVKEIAPIINSAIDEMEKVRDAHRDEAKRNLNERYEKDPYLGKACADIVYSLIYGDWLGIEEV